MNKWIEILTGLILLIGVIYVCGINLWGFGTAALEILKGGIAWIVALIGILLIIIGISDLRE